MGTATASAQFERLVEGVKATEGSRYIAIVTCNTPPERRALIERLREALADADIELHVLEVNAERTSLPAAVKREFEGLGGESDRKLAFAVDWQESAIDPEELADRERTPTAIQQVNLGREYFVDFPHPVIVLVPDYVHDLMAKDARDWYRIRTTSFEFPAAVEAAHASVAQSLAAGEWTAGSAEELAERMASYEAALKRIEGRTGGREQELRARLLSSMGIIHSSQGRYDEAIGMYEESLKIRREFRDRQGEGATLGNMANAHCQLRGRYDEAMEMYEESLAIFRELGDKQGEGAALNGIAIIHETQGRYNEATGMYEASLKIKREIGDRQGEGAALSGIAIIHQAEGRHDEAMAMYEDSLGVLREVGDRHGEGTTLNNMAVIHQAEGRYEDAKGIYEESLAIRRELGDRYGEGQTLGNMANVHFQQGRYDEAMGMYEESLKIRREIGDRLGEGQTLMNMGRLMVGTSAVEKAKQCWQEALAVLEGLGVPEERQVREWLAGLGDE